jgi:uncharacterized membrane protein YdjX (TVP38/TMEM64 family)
MTMTENVRPADEGGLEESAGRRWRRYWPLTGLVVASVLAFAFDLHQLVSFETLQQHDRALREAVGARPLAMALGYVAAYALVVATGLPVTIVMTVAGGYFFGIWIGGGLAVTGATLGAVGVFLVAGTSFGRRLGAGSSPLLARMRAGFQDNAWSYLFILRLLPLLPFMVVNVVPALLGVRLRVFAPATFFGMLPGSFVYASVGNGLGAIMARGDRPDLDLILQPEILVPLLGLAILALLPVAYKTWKGRQDNA